MATFDDLQPLPLPSNAAWSSLGLAVERELHGGQQSRVFAARQHRESVVVKLTDSRLAGPHFSARLEVAEAAARADDSVVAPRRIDSNLVQRLDDWLAVTYPFANGQVANIDDRSDVRRMAVTLAGLHRALEQLDPFFVPAVRALADVELSGNDHGFGPHQILHGDFSHSNVLVDGGSVRVLDFDECGYGPIEFELGNTLYMVLFDASMASEPARYERFRAWFLDDYRSMADRLVPDTAVDVAIRLRVDALSRWVERPESAPIGILTASAAWRDSLRSFVRSQRRD